MYQIFLFTEFLCVNVAVLILKNAYEKLTAKRKMQAGLQDVIGV